MSELLEKKWATFTHVHSCSWTKTWRKIWANNEPRSWVNEWSRRSHSRLYISAFLDAQQLLSLSLGIPLECMAKPWNRGLKKRCEKKTRKKKTEKDVKKQRRKKTYKNAEKEVRFSWVRLGWVSFISNFSLLSNGVH